MQKAVSNKIAILAGIILLAVLALIFWSVRTHYSRQIFETIKSAMRPTAIVSSTKIPFGTLKGKISIGPLCPAEPCAATSEKLAEVYKGRTVFIYSKASKEKIGQTNVKAGGSYQISLAEGKYIINISDYQGKEVPLDQQGLGMGNSFPQDVSISGGKAADLDFAIDTGIR